MRKSKFFVTSALLAVCLAFGGAFFSVPAAQAHAAENVLLSDTYQAETSLINPPTVIFDVKSAPDLTELRSSLTGRRPGSAILHISAQKNVVDEDGNAIGTLADTVNSIRAKVIPILAVETAPEAEALISYIRESGLVDTAVLSSDPVLVKSVRDACPNIRGVLHIRSDAAWSESNYEYVRAASLCGAGVVMLSAEEATWERVTYLQSRFKAVWAISSDEFDDIGAIVNGAYGIVTEDFSATYDVFESFTEPVHARMPFNVAHRGLQMQYNENSVSGTKAAIEAGATHVELDGKLTKDGEIVMMHDDDIRRTTNGEGNIESMTLAEVKEYSLIAHSPEEKIPTLTEILSAFRFSDAILVFEIKTKNTALVTRLKEILDKENFYENIVVIAFDYPNLEEMRRLLPEIPTADLNSYSEKNFAEMLPKLGQYSCAVSTNGSSTKEFNEKYLRDRGVIGWYWTQADGNAVDEAFEKGLTGLTNNVADHLNQKADIYRVVMGQTVIGAKSASIGDRAPLTAVRYDGETVDVIGEVVYLRAGGSDDPNDSGFYSVIAKYVSGDMTYYTPVFHVYLGSGGGGIGSRGGCFGVVGVSSAVALSSFLLLAAGALVLTAKRHRSKK